LLGISLTSDFAEIGARREDERLPRDGYCVDLAPPRALGELVVGLAQLDQRRGPERVRARVVAAVVQRHQRQRLAAREPYVAHKGVRDDLIR
jgi:hypothetical protein